MSFTVRKRLSSPNVYDSPPTTPNTPDSDTPPSFPSVAKADAVAELDERDLMCNIFGWRPQCLQIFNNMKVFMVCFTCLTIFRGITYSYFASMLPSIEKRFGLSSQSIGSVKAMGDVSHLMSALIIAHFGGAGHRPRWIAGGTLMVGAGFLLMCSTELFFPPSSIPSVAHVLSVSSDATEPLCSATRNTTDSTHVHSMAACLKSRETNIGPLIVLGAAEFVCGLGSTAAVILGMPFVDDNVQNKNSPLYFAMSFAGFLFGPIVGYALSALFNTIYFNFTHPDFSPSDPRWISAWYLGYIVSGLGCCLTGFIISCFPSTLVKPKKQFNIETLSGKNVNDASGNKLSHQTSVVKPKPVTLKDLPINLKRLLKNKTYMLKVTGQLLNSFALTGYTAFTQKFLKEQYRLPQSVTNLAGGLPPVATAFLGIACGSIIIRHFKLRPRQICYMMATSSLVASAMYFSVIALGCDKQLIMGIDDVPDPYNTTSPDLCMNQHNCNCADFQFSPVCETASGISYISACAAGCQGSRRGHKIKATKYYANCLCTGVNATFATSIESGSQVNPNFTSTVKGGVCPKSCSNFVNYVIVISIGTFFLGLPVTGVLMIQFRIVDVDLKSLASGLSTIVMSALGMLPAPIVIGKLIDSSCRLWQTDECGNHGACWIYNADDFRWKLHALIGGVRIIGCCIELTISYRVRNLSFDRDAETIGDVPSTSSQLNLTMSKDDGDNDEYPPEMQGSEVWAEARRRSIFISDAVM